MMNSKNDSLKCITITTRSSKAIGDEEPKNMVEANAKVKASILVDDDASKDVNDGILDLEDLSLGNCASDYKLKVGEGYSRKTTPSKNPPHKVNTLQIIIILPFPQRLTKKVMMLSFKIFIHVRHSIDQYPICGSPL